MSRRDLLFPDTVTVDQIKNIFPVHVSRSWIERHVPGKRRLGRYNRWLKADVMDWIANWSNEHDVAK